MVQDSWNCYSDLLNKTSRWFDRAKAALLDNLPCARGCCHCCVGVFPVTIFDRQVIQQGLRLLCSEVRQAIVQRATAQVKLIETNAPELIQNPYIDRWADRDIDVLVERFRDLACPALDPNGSCAIYDFRPLTCRSMGLPHEVDGVIHSACAVQTSVPLVRLSRSLRDEEDRLLLEETTQLERLLAQHPEKGEELMLPYAFLPEGSEEPVDQRRVA